MHSFTRNEDGTITVSGPLREMWRILNESVRGLNASHTSRDVVGRIMDTETLEYSGCIGSMQRNETDVVFEPLIIPIIAPNITNTVVDGYEKIGFVSAYNQSDATRDSQTAGTDVLDMMAEFPFDLWIVILISAAFLIILMAGAIRMRLTGGLLLTDRIFVQRSRQVVKVASGLDHSVKALVACAFHQASPTPYRTSSYRLAYFCMSLFSFFVGMYLTSLIKTDMVTVKRPVTVESYQEILDSGRMPAWLEILQDTHDFEHAEKGSLEAKIWDRAVKNGIENSVVKSSVESIISSVIEVAKFQKVIIVERLMGEWIVPYNGCAFSRTKGFMPYMNALYRHDPSARETLQGNVQNHLFPEGASRHVNNRKQLIFEAGLMPKATKISDLASVLQLEGIEKHYRSIMSCCSNEVLIDQPNWQAANLHFYYSLIYLSGVCFAVAVVALAIESGRCKLAAAAAKCGSLRSISRMFRK
jgi:hypothetical protein